MTKAKTITINTSAFVGALGIAQRFAAQDDYLPQISSVLLSEIDGKLHLQATDRYRLAIVRAHADVPSGLRHVIRLADVKRIRRVFTATRKSNPDLTITIDETLSITSESSELGRVSLTFPTPLLTGDVTYPDLLKILQDGRDGEPVTSVQARFLADFRDFSDGREPVRLRRRGPMLIAEGNRAVGAVMGMRVTEAWPSWSTVLGPDEPAPAEAVA